MSDPVISAVVARNQRLTVRLLAGFSAAGTGARRTIERAPAANARAPALAKVTGATWADGAGRPGLPP